MKEKRVNLTDWYLYLYYTNVNQYQVTIMSLPMKQTDVDDVGIGGHVLWLELLSGLDWS